MEEWKNIADLSENFNKKYSDILNDYYGWPKGNLLYFSACYAFYDALIVDLTEGNDASQFFVMTILNLDEYVEKISIFWKCILEIFF